MTTPSEAASLRAQSLDAAKSAFVAAQAAWTQKLQSNKPPELSETIQWNLLVAVYHANIMVAYPDPIPAPVEPTTPS